MTVSKHLSSDARWIWLPQKPEINQYACFRKTFSLKTAPKHATVSIAVDSDYALWLNGQEVYGRQFPCWPQTRYFDTHDITSLLKKGKNSIAVLAYYRGEDASDYRKGKAGLLLCAQIDDRIVATDNSWLCREHPGFKSGPVPKTTLQMGFTVEYDARRVAAWQHTSFKTDKAWNPAREISGATDGYWSTLMKRPFDGPLPRSFIKALPIHLGQLYREPSPTREPLDAASRYIMPSGEKGGTGPLTAAEAVACDYCRVIPFIPGGTKPVTLQPTAKTTKGMFVVYDLGQEDIGIFSMKLDAPAGTVIDIAHGEHLEDLGVRAYVGGRQFADRYICKQGENEFSIPFRRFGCRYIQLHVTKFKEPVTLEYVGLLPLRYPLQEKGKFESTDTKLRDILETAKQTVKLGMMEHYMDCPWREQSMYAFDSRNTALFGYYAFGEYQYPVPSFSLLGDGQRRDGLLELCAPARVPITIPIFSLIWISALRDHCLFSGRTALIKKYRASAQKILETFLEQKDEKTGLYGLFHDDRYWTFYEWAPGLDFKSDKPPFGNDGVFRLDAPHNLFLMEAMRAYSDSLRFLGETKEAATWSKLAKELGMAVHKKFWNPKKRVYATFADRRKTWHYAELTQALALDNQIVPAKERKQLQNLLFTDNGLVPMTLSTLFYGYRATIGATSKRQESVLAHCQKLFGDMLKTGATSFWESPDGAKAFDLAGSLCHPWSAVPIWITQAYIAGVRPLEPGFKTFTVEPHPCNLPRMKSTIPTPGGPVHIEWDFTKSDKINVRAPKGLKAVPKGKEKIRINILT